MLTTFDFKPGQVIKVYQKIQEGEKTRTQMFKGVLLGIKGRGENRMFTVMKMVGNVSVERIWPIASPLIEKVELDSEPKRRVRKAKLNHLKAPKK